MQGFFLLWVEVVHKLSLNRKNVPAMLDACFPFVCFRIATLNGVPESLQASPVGVEVAKFCGSALTVFKNLVYPATQRHFVVTTATTWFKTLPT